MTRSSMGVQALVCAVAMASSGCGGSHGKAAAATTATGEVPVGKVRRAAPSNPHKEIPTRFTRAVQLPYKSTVLLVTANHAVDPLPVRPRAPKDDRMVGVVLGIRNIGDISWSGRLAQLSRLALSTKNRPERVVKASNSSDGPCPDVLVQSHAAVTNAPVTARPGRTVFACVRFNVPRHEKAILFKFAAVPADFTAYPLGPGQGHGYGVWALPGTLVEQCRFEPSLVKGHCHGLEADEG
jgi:hypothetical protein